MSRITVPIRLPRVSYSFTCTTTTQLPGWVGVKLSRPVCGSSEVVPMGCVAL